ncbi:MAG: lysylphosphatidylglycerol synthase transmembrane domain-containing protein [Anaerolineae bacterium]
MNVLRIVVSVGALAFLFWKVVSPDETLEVVRRADLSYLLAAFLLFVLSLVIRAYRWILLLRGLDLTIPFGRLVRLYFIGQFFSSFLPTQFGGDVMRAVELTEDTDASAAVGTVLLDRMTGLLVLLAMGLAALPFIASQMERWLTILLVVVEASGLVLGALILEGRVLRRLTGWLPRMVSLVGEGPLAKTYAAVTGCGWPAVSRALLVSVGFNVVNIMINWLCGRAVGVGVGLGYFFAATPVLSVSGMIPSVGGWGVREAVSAALFTPAGTEENVAIALGLALNGITLATGLVGGVIYGVDRLLGARVRQTVQDPHRDDH